MTEHLGRQILSRMVIASALALGGAESAQASKSIMQTKQQPPIVDVFPFVSDQSSSVQTALANVRENLFGHEHQYSDPSVTDFYTQASHGKFNLTVNLEPNQTIPDPHTCDFGKLAQIGEKAIQNANVPIASDTMRVFVYPQETQCPFPPAATFKKEFGRRHATTVVLGDQPALTYNHEIGHELGLQHEDKLSCTPQNVYSAANCTVTPYAHSYDIQGMGMGEFDGPHALELGVLSQKDLIQVHHSGEYTISPLESTANAPHMLEIPHGSTSDESTFISYRTPTGLDGLGLPHIYSGAEVVLWDNKPDDNTLLVAHTGPNGNSADPLLTDGETFIDANDHVTITQKAHTPQSLTLDISLPSNHNNS